MVYLQQMDKSQSMQRQIDDQRKKESPKMTFNDEDDIQQQRDDAGQKVKHLASAMADSDDQCHLTITPVVVDVTIVVD